MGPALSDRQAGGLTGPFADAAAESRRASQVWLFYDPSVDHDRRHVQRFDGPNVTRVPLRHADWAALMLRATAACSAT